MIFLIEYDRERGRIVKLETFKGSERNSADESRLNLELQLRLKGTDNEVVLLEAASEAAVRRTHRRYFENLTELISAPVH
jgi:hypothetical protein